jgi:hypothetical protein
MIHSILFASQAFLDGSRRLPLSPIARHHLAKAIYHLQQSLNNKAEYNKSATLVIITSLAMAEIIAGNLDF